MSENSYNQNSIKETKNAVSAASLVKEGQGNVLLVTALTGLGFNMAPHFGMYQILNYLHHNNLKCDMI